MLPSPYTARTFNEERYDIWSMRSEYHNIPTINGVQQKPGRQFEARCVDYDGTRGLSVISILMQKGTGNRI